MHAIFGHRRLALGAAMLLLGATGCATLRSTFTGYATGPAGIARPQQRQREALASSDFRQLLEQHDADKLLDALDTGMIRYYASQFAQSAAALDTAALIADDRITASLSKDALALVTNDMARPYQPRRTERLFIPYYGMLAWARLGEWEDAAVEARRLVSLLALYTADRDDGERALHSTLHYVAGVVFERAGDLGEAGVAYRAAAALRSVSSDSAAPALRPGEGEILVILERGFVAHRSSEQIEIPIDAAERDSSRDLRRRHHEAELVTIAFPALRRSGRPWGGAIRVRVDESHPATAAFVAEVDDATAADERRERSAIVTRAIARAAAKYAATKVIRDKKGEVAGDLAKFGADLLERADVRSWHLLPQEVSVARFRVPAGSRAVRLEVGEGGALRRVELGTVNVTAGLISLVPVRLFRDAPAAAPVLIASHDSACAVVSCP